MRRLRRGATAIAAVLVTLAGVLLAATSEVATPAPVGALAGVTLDEPARATAMATRGRQTPLRPAPDRCTRVIVIGDSLMDNARWYLLGALDRAGFVHFVDAQHSRRIPESVRAPYSGVTAAREVRAIWGEADCWVIALGSNDLIYGAGDPAVARSSIDAMLAATTPGAFVWWVNVDYHRDPAWSFDFVGATARFNATLTERAATDPNLRVIDWYSLAEAHPAWFFDPVHVGAAGSLARAEQTVDALPR